MFVGFQRTSLRTWLTLAFAVLLALAGALALGGLTTASAQESYEAQIWLKDSNGNGLSGATVRYRTSGSWNVLGVTDEDGLATATLPKQEYRIRIEFRRGYVDTIDPVDVTDYTFHTVKVHFLNTKTMHFQGYYKGWGSFSGPIELLPFTYDFSNQNNLKNRFELTIGPEGFTGALLRLIDSNGDGLEGGTASYYLGDWYGIPGATDENGNLVFSVPNDSPNLTVRMSYKGTAQQKTRTQLDDSNFTFQTALVTVELRNADGDLFDTGEVSYFETFWRTFGDGTTSGGIVTQEMLPGDTTSIAMVYNHSRQQKNDIVISAPATTVTFQTGRLNLSYSGSVSWYHTGWWAFTSGMEFLPGVETFYLSTSAGNCGVDIAIASGDKLVKSGIAATLRNSSGTPLAGGEATAYAGGWKSIGTTNSSGRTCAVFDGTLGNTTARMVYAGTSRNLTQHHPTDSTYDFTTSLVTVELRDSGNNLIDTGSASYYAGGWKSLGDTSGGVVTADLLPGNYSFAMVYNGTRQQLNAQPISGSASTVTFTTALVTVELRDSGGALIDTGSASYYASGWKSIGDTSGGVITVEMLPGSYSFAMTYLGTRQQLNGQVIDGDGDTVTFQTGEVQSNGTAVSYYAGGWKTFTDGMELLPGTYTFSFNDGTPNTAETIHAGMVNQIGTAPAVI